MPVDISEKNFEAAVERSLLSPLPPGGFVPGGYRKRTPDDYHRALCLDPDVVLEFVYATQPQEWDKLKAQHGADVKAKFLHGD